MYFYYYHMKLNPKMCTFALRQGNSSNICSLKEELRLTQDISRQSLACYTLKCQGSLEVGWTDSASKQIHLALHLQIHRSFQGFKESKNL